MAENLPGTRAAAPGPSQKPMVHTRHVPASSADLLINHVEPQYPYIAQCSCIEGDVTVRARLASEGTVKTVRVLDGHSYLAGAAVEAVRQWRYRRRLRQDTEPEITIILSFRLEG
jgi:TonB family protein